MTASDRAFLARLEYARHMFDDVAARNAAESARHDAWYAAGLYAATGHDVNGIRYRVVDSEADDAAFENEIVERELNGEYTGVQL